MRFYPIVLTVLCFAFTAPLQAQPLRVLGTDISYWNCGTSATGISQANWNTAFTTGNRVFVQIRATRGGTTGVDQPQGTPGGGSLATLSRRYDDSRFLQNITRATVAGMIAGPYHFSRPDVADNTGTDEADHHIEMAGVFMRPGYMMPMYDLEATLGDNNRLRNFSIDFSARIYGVMQIRPCIYINGNYSGLLDSGSTPAQRNALAQPAALTPSVVSPAFPMLWNARYSDNTADWVDIPVQTGSPKHTYTTVSAYYGPWDDYGNTEPWSFWQYASVASIPGFNAVDATIDVDVSHGDIEYVRNYLVPAVWWNDSSGDWSTLANWNSGQPAPTPVTPADQATPYAYTASAMPTARLPGAAGTGPTSGQYDTVILERPAANITVTLSSGTHNIRKLYMREALNITGGSLTVNYNPAYRANDSATVLHGGPISAQFSGPVTLSGSGSLSLHTLQVDAAQTFTLNGGTLTFNTLNLNRGATPGKLALGGNVNFNPLAGATATITNGSGAGNPGLVDLGGGNRAFNVGNGTAAVDLLVAVPVSNGAISKTGPGTMRLAVANTYNGGTTITAGTLEGGAAASIPGNVTNTAGTLKLDNASTMPSSATLVLASAPAAGAVNLNFAGTQNINALYFGTTQQPAGTWAASGASHNHPAFTGSGVLNVLTGPPATSITTVARTSGSNPSIYGDSLTFTSTVTGSSPGGTVQFNVDGAAVGGPVTLVGGSAALVLSTLSVAGSPHQMTAYYSGDVNNQPSDSSASPVAQTVTARPTSCALASSENPAEPGANVTFTATVNAVPPIAELPAGDVIFSADGAPFATNALVSGSAGAGTASLPVGTNAITAQYLGAANFLGSADSVDQVVQLLVTCAQTNALLSLSDNLDGTFTLTFVGTPQAEYYVVANPDMLAPMPNWSPLAGSTNTVTNANGLWQFTVTNTVPQQFYRGKAVAPCPGP